MSNPLKSKGIGELGICGAGASLSNAIYNACGARVRDYPITLDKMLSSLPTQTWRLIYCATKAAISWVEIGKLNRLTAN